jgi:hypothetical protein
MRANPDAANRPEKETSMINSRFFCLMTLATTVALGPQLVAQVQTDVPAVIPGAILKYDVAAE